MADESVLAWLVDADPAVRWQVERDLLDAPEATWRATRARVETEGWGARLLAHQDADGQWAGGAFVPSGFDWQQWQAEGQPWTATYPVLTLLRGFGLDPASPAARRTTELVGRNSRWDHAGQPFWAGEVEPCINGITLANGVYYGADVAAIVERLLDDQRPDGGWNCEDSPVSSFDSTINVLEGLLAWQQATGAGETQVARARRAGEEYLLERGLFRRRSTGRPADAAYLQLGHPFRWRHSVLRGLDHFRRAAGHDRTPPDPRLAEAVAWLRSARAADGTWPLQARLAGRDWFELEPIGQPSRWITLFALRVLRWWDGYAPAGA